MIDFYYAPTPNGWKVAIMLAETGLAYNVILMRLTEGDQFNPNFLKISPNAKIPAILDHDGEDGPVTVFESGAILLYLADKTKSFAADGSFARKELLEWLFWQAGNQGPMAGQLSHFVNYAPLNQGYSLQRYKGEYERNLGVLERHLESRDYILHQYSIADMMAFPWVFIAKPLGVSLDHFPQVKNWRACIKSRPAVRQAIELFKNEQFSGKTSAGMNRTLFNQNAEHIALAKR